MAQSIEAFVGSAMDDARMKPIHWQVPALVAAGYFFDVLDLTIHRALVRHLDRDRPWRALIVFVLRFSLPESPLRLATHCKGQRALDLQKRMNLPAPPLETLTADAASNTKSDPIAVVLLQYPRT